MHATQSLFAAVLIAAGISSVAAQSAPADEPAETSFFGLGAALNMERQAYAGVGTENHLYPLVRYESRLFSIEGATADLHLLGDSTLSFSARAQYGLGEGYKAGDSPALAGMNERRSSVWLGGVVEWDAGWADLTAALTGDASGRSKGRQFGLTLERDVDIGRLQLTPRVAATWQDDDYVDYYYGVRRTEVRPGRAAYEGKSAINTEVGLHAQYSLTERQFVYLDLSANRLGSGVRDSPIVDRTWLPAVRAGYLHRF
jgi:outer membrane scaffolding protein for murein synthesis (MipA/OmpV family)